MNDNHTFPILDDFKEAPAAKIRITRRLTGKVMVRDLQIGAGAPVSVQSMCATRTQDIDATVKQVEQLAAHGADIIRIAVDSRADVAALKEIRSQSTARLVVDLQESYKLAKNVAPYIDKIRYNPGHLYHHEQSVSIRDKVKFLVEVARDHSLAIRIGVNFGSLDPERTSEDAPPLQAALHSAREHVGYMRELGFSNFVVSLKSSDPNDVTDINLAFAQEFPEIPLHLGVTEAGMLPMGEVKTRVAFEGLLARGIGETVRVSLTLPHQRKHEEVLLGKQIIEDVYAGRFRSVPRFEHEGLNIISCPSCSRVENEAFVELAEKVREMTNSFARYKLTIAVMGCRVNGPGETDDADLGLWCAPNHVNMKRGHTLVGQFSYDEVIGRVKHEIEAMIAERGLLPQLAGN